MGKATFWSRRSSARRSAAAGALFTAALLVASTATGRELHLKAGATLTTFVGPKAAGIKPRIGPAGGVGTELRLWGTRWRPEMLFEMRGARSESTADDGVKSTYTTRVGYFALPLLACAQVLGTDGLDIDLVLGPQLSFSLFASERVEVGGESGGTATDSLIEDTAAFDLGAAGGVVLGLPIDAETRLTLDARASMGFLPVFTNDAAERRLNLVGTLLVGLEILPETPEKARRGERIMRVSSPLPGL